MKKLNFKSLLLLFFSMTWGFCYGQTIANPTGFNVIEDSLNVKIQSKINYKTFDVLKNNPYSMNFIKNNIPNTNGLCPRYVYREIDIRKLIQNYPLLKIDPNYKFDFADVCFNYYCGLNYTIIAYSVSLNKAIDNEGSAATQKSIFSFVVLDKNLKIKWIKNVELLTDNYNEFVISYDGNYFIKKGEIFENNLLSNHIFLYSFIENKILYNFLPTNPSENSQFDISSYGTSQNLAVSIKKVNKKPIFYYFNQIDLSIYEHISSEITQGNIEDQDLKKVWDSKNKKVLFFHKNDKKNENIIKSYKYKLIKKLK
ncbi:MAG: hypothetical protein IPL95_12325 [Saprospiraceae bacterium]|nr:hypothetical protein [Saprospiraceae bacterium]